MVQKNDEYQDDRLEITLQPLDSNAINKGPGEDQATIRTFMGKQNRILLGKPRSRNYIASLLEESPQLPDEIESLASKGYEFQHITTNLSLLPDKGCAFVSVDFSIELLAEDKAGAVYAERPIVYEISPNEVVREVKYKEAGKLSAEVGGEIQSGIAKVLSKISQEESFEQDGVLIFKEIYGYGVNFSEAGWRFRAHQGKELSGDTDRLELIVQFTHDTRLMGRFHVAAEVAVEVSLDNWLTTVFTPSSKDNVLEVLYPLSNI